MRNRNTPCPEHIDPQKLPKGCYWDGRGRGRWYTTVRVDGKQRTARLAGPEAKLSELHRLMELHQGKDVDNLIWLRNRFRESIQYQQISKGTQDDYNYCAQVVENHPSKLPAMTIGQVPLSSWNPPACQKLIDQIAANNGPSTAAHCARYLRRLFNWSVQRGLVSASPLGKIELPKERKRRRLPQQQAVSALVTLAQERGAIPTNQKDSCPHYIWKALLIAYRCRLRGVEVFSLTDACVMDEGLLCERRKGSNATITQWAPDLRAAVTAAQAYRDALWQRQRHPVPLRPEDRLLLVGRTGGRVTSSAWQCSWRAFLDDAIEAGVITEEQRFGLHDMKRRGITDTKGGKSAKLEGGGHKSPAMLEPYDFEIPVVPAAGK